MRNLHHADRPDRISGIEYLKMLITNPQEIVQKVMKMNVHRVFEKFVDIKVLRNLGLVFGLLFVLQLKFS